MQNSAYKAFHLGIFAWGVVVWGGGLEREIMQGALGAQRHAQP